MQSHRWVFTLQKPKEEDRPILWPDVSFLVYQLEGPNPHYQGYVEFFLSKSFKEMKALHPKAYWHIAYGDRHQNVEYCTKEKTRLGYPVLMKVAPPIKLAGTQHFSAESSKRLQVSLPKV